MYAALSAIGENPCKECTHRNPGEPCPERDTCRERNKYDFRRKICKQVSYIRMSREFWLNYGHRRGTAISKERKARRYE